MCLRITPQEVAKAVHSLPFKNNKVLTHKIVVESFNLVEKAYFESRGFFCGKSKLRIIGGLMYIMALKYSQHIDEIQRFADQREWYKGFVHQHHTGKISQREIVLYLKHLAFSNSTVDWAKVSPCELTVRKGFKDWSKILPEILGE